MGLFSKLMFWKKEEPFPAPKEFGHELGLPKEEGLGLPEPGGLPGLGKEHEEGLPPSPAEAFGAPRLEEAGPEPPMHPEMGPLPAAPAAAPSAASGKDLEIISLKLDSLKTTLEAINERLARLEKMAEGGRESSRF